MSKKICTIPNFQTNFKVTVIGAGNVGATAAYAMLTKGTPTELVLLDRQKEKAEGLIKDMEHSMAFLDYTRVIGTDDYTAAKNSHLVVITAGARQEVGETRLDLLEKNRRIMRSIADAILPQAPNAIYLMVTNPVDILTYEFYQYSRLPWGRVFGTGTLLDTARLRFHLSKELCLNPKSIEAFVLGEHGDSSFPVWSTANIAGKLLTDMPGFSKEEADQAYQDTRNAAYKIIQDVGYTCYSIATVIREVMEHIFQHSRIVLPLSIPLEKPYQGVSGVSLSVPCVLDSTGVAETIELPLNILEKKQFKKSAEVLKGLLVKREMI